jgi:hypothetical protein
MKQALRILVLVCLPISCFAQEERYYLGASIGQVMADDWCRPSHANCSDTDAAWKLYAGHRFHRHGAVEIHYADLGRISRQTSVLLPNPPGGGTIRNDVVRTSALGASVLGILPVRQSNFSVFGKAGLQYLFQSSGANSVGDDQGGVAPALGVGIEFRFARHLSLRAEAEHVFRLGAELLTLGFRLSF